MFLTINDLNRRDTMEKARNYFRIRLNLSIGALSVVGCLLFVISGKNAVHRGENIQKQNLEWHRQYNKSHEPTQA